MELSLNTIHLKREHEDDFWYMFLTMLECSIEDKRLQLSHREKEIISFILCGVPDKDYFRRDLRKSVLARFKISSAQLSQIRSSLNKKGWLNEMLLDSKIREVQRQFKKLTQNSSDDVTIKLNFALKYKNNESRT